LFTGTNGNDFKFQEYYKVVEYFANYTKARMGLAMGVNNLVDIFDEKYYRHLSGGILEALVNYSSAI
jgi:outer membrane receptor protein involved in Fe transport